MRRNKLREMLKAGKPTLGTHLRQHLRPATVEIVGHSGMFDYVEFVAEYAPFDLFTLDNFCRAVELLDMSAKIKVDQEPRRFLAQRGIGAGFQSVLFADCRSVTASRNVCALCGPRHARRSGSLRCWDAPPHLYGLRRHPDCRSPQRCGGRHNDRKTRCG